MKILDCGPLQVCADCAQLIANDEATDEHRGVFRVWQDEYGDGATLVLGDDMEDFAISRCDGCGSVLAGSRFEVFALVRENQS